MLICLSITNGNKALKGAFSHLALRGTANSSLEPGSPMAKWREDLTFQRQEWNPGSILLLTPGFVSNCSQNATCTEKMAIFSSAAISTPFSLSSTVRSTYSNILQKQQKHHVAGKWVIYPRNCHVCSWPRVSLCVVWSILFNKAQYRPRSQAFSGFSVPENRGNEAVCRNSGLLCW